MKFDAIVIQNGETVVILVKVIWNKDCACFWKASVGENVIKRCIILSLRTKIKWKNGLVYCFKSTDEWAF